VSRPLQPKGWYPLLLGTATVGISNSVVFTLLSDLQDRYHFSDAGLGLIAGTGFLFSLIGVLLIAPFADRGHAKTLLVVGLGLAVLGSVMFAASTNLVMLVVSRAIVGLSNSVYGPSSRAIAITMSGPEEIGHRLGRMSGVELGGFVLGPTIGGLVMDTTHNIHLPFLVCGAFAAAGAVLIALRQFPEPPIGERHRVAFDLLRLPQIRAGVLMGVALFVPVGIYDATLDRYLTDMGASNRLIGVAFLTFGIPFTLFAARGGRLSDRYGPVKIGLLAACGIAPLTAYYGFITVPVAFVALGFVEGTLQSMGIPAASAIIARGAPEGRVAAAQGLSGAGSMVLGAATAYAAGPMYEHLGPHWMYGSAGAGVLLLALIAAHQGRSRVPAAV
jgi:MFS family permease